VTGPLVNDDIVLACVDLVDRTGATGFQMGYLHEDVPIAETGWFAYAQYRGARITAEDHRSPTAAALALAERLLDGAMCACTKPVSLSDDKPGCRWRLVGKRWERPCDAKPLHVAAQRGDTAAMQDAFANRAARRANRKGRRRG
jgi:hypothetical protein